MTFSGRAPDQWIRKQFSHRWRSVRTRLVEYLAIIRATPHSRGSNINRAFHCCRWRLKSMYEIGRWLATWIMRKWNSLRPMNRPDAAERWVQSHICLWAVRAVWVEPAHFFIEIAWSAHSWPMGTNAVGMDTRFEQKQKIPLSIHYSIYFL